MTANVSDSVDSIDDMFKIGVRDFDTSHIVEQIRARVADNMKKGVYADLSVARAERTNLCNLRDEEEFLTFYMDCLRDTCFVDINDFEIVERRPRFAKLLVRLKRSIWSMLKFYTYRLWSQQNQINGLFLSTIEITDARYRETLAKQDARIHDLEQRLATAEKEWNNRPACSENRA